MIVYFLWFKDLKMKSRGWKNSSAIRVLSLQTLFMKPTLSYPQNHIIVMVTQVIPSTYHKPKQHFFIGPLH